MPFLSVEGVSKRFGRVTAVDQVSFAVDRGQVVGFLGPNGAGKSTTMRMITQYYEPDTGTIALDGVPLADAARASGTPSSAIVPRSEEHTSELQSHVNLVCRLLLEKKKKKTKNKKSMINN